MSLNGYMNLPESWLNVLVFIHVVSAIVGVGPTFFSHVLMRKGQTYGQLRGSLGTAKMLEKFPKIGGSLAVLTGLLLAWLGDYGFQDFWIYASIADYVIIQIVVIGFMAPAAAKLGQKVFGSADPADQPVSPEIAAGTAKINNINWIATVFGVLLFVLMFFKPTL
ncbi:DUF2269 family protein [Cohnella caldifontis]|uniref:DUF2269 family protein n=1 Tax=Cohnella caldifontis TaxID=3027471 RepID=UPI0023EBBDDD|nr:DUF2269 family protein [Cohnella sp. YIM B05605]